MYKVSRMVEIKKELVEKGHVNVCELSDIFNVSTVTIRNDLSILEREGYLIRTRGGAVLREGTTTNGRNSDESFVIESADKKERIGAVAEKHILEGSWIYISSGTTCFELAKKLLNRNLKIVTAGLDTAIELSKSKLLEILIPGGNLVRGNGFSFLAGDWYLRALDQMRFDQAYVGVSGVDLEAGFTVNNTLEFKLIEKIKSVSRETIVVADSTKFGYRSFMSVAGLTYADTVITNNDIPHEYREYFEEHNIMLLTD